MNVCALHAERVEQPLLNEISPGGAGRGLHGPAGHEKHQGLILKQRPKRVVRLEEGQLADDRVRIPGSAIPEIIVAAQPGAVRDQVAQRHVGVGERIGEMKDIDVLPHRIVPAHLALIHEQRHRGGRECLGTGADGEHRVGRDGIARAQLADAEVLKIDDAIIAHDGDADSGHIPELEGLADNGVDRRRVERGIGRLEGKRAQQGQKREAD